MTILAPPRPTHRSMAWLLLMGAAWLWVRPVGAQQAETAAATPASRWPINVETAPRPLTHAVKTSGRIEVDGRLDEAAWAAAIPITEFVQSQPHPGYPASERTAVRILYDERRLYIGAMCYESTPGQLVVLSLEQDFPGGSTRDSDIFGVTLDPFWTGRTRSCS